MAKEKRFRAIDAIRGQTFFSGGYVCLADYFNVVQVYCDTVRNIEHNDYAGRKDKNGVELYEGELIEYPVTSYPLEVVWDDFCCAFMLRDTKGDLMAMPPKESMATYSLSIGNIYEQKEE